MAQPCMGLLSNKRGGREATNRHEESRRHVAERGPSGGLQAVTFWKRQNDRRKRPAAARGRVCRTDRQSTKGTQWLPWCARLAHWGASGEPLCPLRPWPSPSMGREWGVAALLVFFIFPSSLQAAVRRGWWCGLCLPHQPGEAGGEGCRCRLLQSWAGGSPGRRPPAQASSS